MAATARLGLSPMGPMGPIGPMRLISALRPAAGFATLPAVRPAARGPRKGEGAYPCPAGADRPSRNSTPVASSCSSRAPSATSSTACPSSTALRRRFPHAHIRWVVNLAYADLLRGHPDLDEVLTFDRGAVARRPVARGPCVPRSGRTGAAAATRPRRRSARTVPHRPAGAAQRGRPPRRPQHAPARGRPGSTPTWCPSPTSRRFTRSIVCGSSPRRSARAAAPRFFMSPLAMRRGAGRRIGWRACRGRG